MKFIIKKKVTEMSFWIKFWQEDEKQISEKSISDVPYKGWSAYHQSVSVLLVAEV